MKDGGCSARRLEPRLHMAKPAFVGWTFILHPSSLLLQASAERVEELRFAVLAVLFAAPIAPDLLAELFQLAA